MIAIRRFQYVNLNSLNRSNLNLFIIKEEITKMDHNSNSKVFIVALNQLKMMIQ